MFPFLVPTRCLPSKLWTATIIVTRSKTRRRSHSFAQAVACGERAALTSQAPKSSGVFTQKRNIHTDPEGTQCEDTPPSTPGPKPWYSNRRGEEITFTPGCPPPGYVYVPAGNVFVTRKCRTLAQKLYVVYSREKRRRGPAKPVGIHVPADVYKQATSELDVRSKKAGESVGLLFDKLYPLMPPDVRNRLESGSCAKGHDGTVGKLTPKEAEENIRHYIWHHYTPFKFEGRIRPPPDSLPALRSAFVRSKKRVDDMIASWRGKDSSAEESSKKGTRL